MRHWMFAIGLAALMIGLPIAYFCLPRSPRPAPVQTADREGRQGLTPEEIDRFYHLTMGSELIPLAWLRALESKQTGKPFLEEIERFGLLPDPNDADGLPVGLSAAPSSDARLIGKMVGFNCAACHTGEITYQGKSLRLEGAPGLFSGEAFVKDLAESIGATIKSPSNLLAFLKRTLDDKHYADALAAARPGVQSLLAKLPSLDELPVIGSLESRLADQFKKLHKSELESPKGNAAVKDADLKGLLDQPAAVNSPLAALAKREAPLRGTLEHFVETLGLLRARIAFAKKLKAEMDLKLPSTAGGPGRVDDFGSARNLLFDVKDARPITAPCSVPHLWGTAQLRWTDWDGNTQSALGRSLATALAGGAAFDPKTFKSTVPPRNLAHLDRLAEKITPPAWPEAIFGKVDQAKAKRGAVLYQTHCSKCHIEVKRAAVVAPPEMSFSVKEIGTDPARLENYAQPLGDRPFADAVKETIDKYLQQACKDANIGEAEAKTLEAGHPNVWRTTNRYVARPLTSIWATAPYLHNGSVPTLYHLLLPADKRPVSFPLGHREYDPAKLGYVTEIQGEPIFRFDTTLTGNRNSGHEFGTELKEEERGDLLEYLKGI